MIPSGPDGRDGRDGHDGHEAARAAEELAQLREQAARAREVLDALQQEMSEAEERFGRDRMSILVEANEQLVLAALRFKAEAEVAVGALEVIELGVPPDGAVDADALIASVRAALDHAKAEGTGSHAHRGRGGAAHRFVHRPSSASLRRLTLRHEQSMTEHERRLMDLQDANEALITAALTAQARQAAAEKAQRKQREFLGTLAHELRTPLTPIRNAASAMGRRRDGEFDASKTQAIIERQIVQMSRLVDDLLDVSRIDTGKLRLDRGPVDIADVVDAAVDATRPAMELHGQRFRVQMPAGGACIDADAGRLVQALSNVLSNASKYTPNAGAIDLRVETVGDRLVIAVSDSGIGIAAEDLRGIFEPFTQGAEAIDFDGTGLGIGLAVVREVVEAHGGSVRAESAGRGLGSRFVISLPLSGRGDPP